MLTQEPVHEDESRPADSGGGVSPVAKVLLTLAVVLVLLLRHDYWQWDTPGYLLFGFLPAGLWWQGLVSLLAAGMMGLMVRYAWPGELEREAVEAERRREEMEQPISGERRSGSSRCSERGMGEEHRQREAPLDHRSNGNAKQSPIPSTNLNR